MPTSIRTFSMNSGRKKIPGELPYLNIGYRASYGEVSAAATRGGYSWSYADKDGVEQNKTADSAAVTQWPDLPVMNVDGTTDMELYFDTKPEKVIATAFTGRTFRRKRSRRRSRSGSRRKRWKLYSKRCTERYDLLIVESGNGWWNWLMWIKNKKLECDWWSM